jgi:hypothetical protein
MALIPGEVNAIIDFETARLDKVSIHSDDPGTTGVHELSGGSYARVALTWPSAAGGSSTTTQVSVNVPAGGPYGYFGVWDNDGTTFRGGNALSTAETFGADGQLKVTLTLAGTAS